jgi:hypothetical protein
MNIPMAVYALYNAPSEDLYALAKACGRERMFDREDEENENMLHPASHTCLPTPQSKTSLHTTVTWFQIQLTNSTTTI